MSGVMICKRTMMQCQTPGMCSPHGGCSDPNPPQTNQGWICGRCQTSNAPWASTCQNAMCGRNFTVTCATDVQTPHYQQIKGPVYGLDHYMSNVDMFNSMQLERQVLQAFKDAQETIDLLNEGRKIDPQDLNRPMSEFPK